MFDIIHSSWHPYLINAVNSSAMSNITEILKNCSHCPATNNIFKVLSMPLNSIKVVILGQDPYPNKDHAIGLAFAVPKNTKPPYSLEKIIDELVMSISFDIGLEGGKGGDFDETLQHWVDQGVFLLNRSLTCQEGIPNSHKHLWQGFTDLIIRTIASNRQNIVWMLWGKDAKSATTIINDYENHNILEANHPASERYGHKYIGCNHFIMTNEILKDLGIKPINWINHDN